MWKEGALLPNYLIIFYYDHLLPKKLHKKIMKYIPNTQFCENYDPHGYPFDILYFFNNIFVKCKKKKKKY